MWSWRFPFVFAALLSICVSAPGSARAASDLDEVDALVKRLNPLLATDYKQAIAEFTRYQQEHPNLTPVAEINLAIPLFWAYVGYARDKKAGMDLCDAMIAKHGTTPLVLGLVANKAGLMTANKQGAEAAALLEKHLTLVDGASPSVRKVALHAYVDALEQAGQRQKIVPALQKQILGTPEFVDEGKQDPPGWMYDRILTCLVDDDRSDEALQWAKLRFVTCSFDTASIERTTRNLARVWTARDLNSVTTNAFAEALKDPAKPNPLADVKLPAVDADALKTKLADLPVGGAAKLHDRVSVMLLAGMLREAMGEARRQLIDDPDSPAGVQEICRVFKAADLSVRRANAFIEYVKSGAGENPLTAFMKEHPAPQPAAK